MSANTDVLTDKFRARCNPDAAPLDLLLRPALWTCAKLAVRGGKVTKVPCDAHGRPWNIAAPGAGMEFASAVAAYRDGSFFAGIGIVLNDTACLAVVDLDSCIDAAGELHPAAMEWVKRANTYAEVSGSGTGLHLFFLLTSEPAALENCAPRLVRGIKTEVYFRQRYILTTFDRVPGTPEVLAVLRPGAISSFDEPSFAGAEDVFREIYRIHRGITSDVHSEGLEPARKEWRRSPELPDDEVIAKCRKAKNAAKFVALFDRGELNAYGGDESAADLALIGIFAFYTQDAEQLQRLFEGSESWPRESAQ